MNRKLLFSSFATLVFCSVSQAQTQPTNTKPTINSILPATTMTRTQIAALLSQELHVSDQQKIVDKEYARNIFSRKTPHAAPEKYTQVLQQLDAIKAAGELRMRNLSQHW